MNSPELLQLSNPSLVLKALQAELQTRRDQNKLATYRPYIKQKAFHFAGAVFTERLFMAGNQLGKTLCAAFETAMHLTGRYPDWWQGRRFERRISAWGASLTGQSTRDTVQRLLLGEVGAWGTGSIPKYSIVEIKRASGGVADAVESILVKHISGGISRITIKTYDQGRERWQGETLDLVWFDEEPPEQIYVEGLTRTNATGGMAYMTFTPLLGRSAVVNRFLIDKPPGTSVTTMTIDDAEHYTPEQRELIVARYPAHEREARARGVPTLGSGAIFPVEESLIKVSAFPIPAHWPEIGALDFGWDHPSAGVKAAWDRDSDIFYITAAHRAKEQTPLLFAANVKPWGDWLPWAWPHDGLQHDKGSGEQLAAQYGAQGLKMLHERATFEDGTNGVEAGLMDMLDRMQTGRWKVFSHLEDWFEEYRMYHRKDGKVVKKGDDLMAASRYAYMMKRFAITKPKPRSAHVGGGAGGWMG